MKGRESPADDERSRRTYTHDSRQRPLPEGENEREKLLQGVSNLIRTVTAAM